jgi:magnesium transporter
MTTWYDIRDPDDRELDRLAEQYRLHPLHIEDCRHGNQSAKVEEQGDYIFVVLKQIELTEKDELHIGETNLFVGKDYVITVEESKCKSAALILDRTKQNQRDQRPDQFLYRIMDAVVDSYLPVLDRFNEEIDLLEDKVLDDPDPATLQCIFDLKRKLIELRRVLTNMRDVAGHLQRTDSDLVGRDLAPFLRDVYDHVARNLDTLETQRDLVNGSMDIYLSSVANRTNQVMKVLTVMGTVAIPALAISGFYGMNIKHLPWAESPHAVWIVSGLIVGTSALVLIVLKKFRWF